MLTVWGRTNSSNVQVVMWAIGELGVAHERIDAGGVHGVVDTQDYLAMNPNGLVPTIEDGDLTLFECAAIVRYLGAQYGDEAFWPRDPRARAALDVWAAWAKITFTPVLINEIFIPMIRQKPEARDPQAFRSAEGRLGKLAAVADARLAGGGYLGGENLTFADIMLGGPLYRYYTLDFERAATPHLDAYYARLTERPAYAEHVMVSYDSLRAQ